MAHRIETKDAPCENPRIPSKGPTSLNVFSMTATLSSKPTDKSLGSMALKVWSSVLNHQPYPESKKNRTYNDVKYTKYTV